MKWSPVAKGLFAKFEALWVKDGVLQRAWEEPATREERWQVLVLKASYGTMGAGHFGVSKTLC